MKEYEYIEQSHHAETDTSVKSLNNGPCIAEIQIYGGEETHFILNTGHDDKFVIAVEGYDGLEIRHFGKARLFPVYGLKLK
jgi:hypothetical protein